MSVWRGAGAEGERPLEEARNGGGVDPRVGTGEKRADTRHYLSSNWNLNRLAKRLERGMIREMEKF